MVIKLLIIDARVDQENFTNFTKNREYKLRTACSNNKNEENLTYLRKELHNIPTDTGCPRHGNNAWNEWKTTTTSNKQGEKNSMQN